MSDTPPYIVGIGGTIRPGSSTEHALRHALDLAGRAGARTRLLDASALDLPPYDPTAPERSPAARLLVDEVRRADAVILASPGYHGGISGHLKNALDYVEDLRSDERPYLDGRCVGLIATGAGWQGAVGTLAALRAVVHALRGWPTPIGVAINTSEQRPVPHGGFTAEPVNQQIGLMVDQMLGFARRWLPARRVGSP